MNEMFNRNIRNDWCRKDNLVEREDRDFNGAF